jgi:hypothetical protein
MADEDALSMFPQVPKANDKTSATTTTSTPNEEDDDVAALFPQIPSSASANFSAPFGSSSVAKQTTPQANPTLAFDAFPSVPSSSSASSAMKPASAPVATIAADVYAPCTCVLA